MNGSTEETSRRPVDPRFAAPVLARIGPERRLGYRGAVRSGRRSGRSDKRSRIRSNPAVKEYSVKLAAGRADGPGLTRTSTPWPGRPTATDSCALLISFSSVLWHAFGVKANPRQAVANDGWGGGKGRQGRLGGAKRPRRAAGGPHGAAGYSSRSRRYSRYSASETPGGVWWSTAGRNPPVRMRGRSRSNSRRIAASPRVITILS